MPKAMMNGRTKLLTPAIAAADVRGDEYESQIDTLAATYDRLRRGFETQLMNRVTPGRVTQAKAG
ncbi:MAG TPA: hypothetical protein VGI60_09510 [Chthoniobacterales bacterium]|jgi:hypothetical protein